MLPAPCLAAAALCITASPTTLYRFLCQVITASLSDSAYSRLCGKMDYPLISAMRRWFRLLILMLFCTLSLMISLFQRNSGDLFLMCFIAEPDSLWVVNRHTHALVSRRFCRAYCQSLMLLQAGVQGCMWVFKHSYTFSCWSCIWDFAVWINNTLYFLNLQSQCKLKM